VANHAVRSNGPAHLRLVAVCAARYAAGVREILECWFEDRPIRNDLIVPGGRLAGAAAHSYSAGDATGGSEEAARFKTPTEAGESTHR